MTPEFMNPNEVAWMKRATEAEQQLQAEKARADKAEEMVAALNNSISTALEFIEDTELNMANYTHDQVDSLNDGMCSNYHVLETAKDLSEQTAQAHNKRKCDEIVGKIEAEKNQGLHYQVIGRTLGLDVAIDIVKSVLGGEG